MRVLFAILACAILVMGSSEVVAHTPASGSGSKGSVKSVVRTVPALFSTAKLVATQTQRLIRGIMAIRGKEKHVDWQYAAKLVREAQEVVAEKGNEWMKPHILLGVAVQETDLRWWLKAGYGSVADCGLTQINITRFRMPSYKKRRLCRALCKKKNTKMSMQWTMKEMRRIKDNYCNATWLKRIKRYHRWTKLRTMTDEQHFWRCVLTVYNQGPRFVTYKYNTCTFKWKRWGPSQARLDKDTKKCRSRNRYFFRAWCFAEGIRRVKVPTYKYIRRGKRRVNKASCRSAYSMAWIDKRYNK